MQAGQAFAEYDGGRCNPLSRHNTNATRAFGVAVVHDMCVYVMVQASQYELRI